MALLNANYLGLYAFADSGQTTAYRVTAHDTLSTAETNFLAAAADGDYGLLVKSSTDDVHEQSNLPAIIQESSSAIVDATGSLKLLAAATTTTLDMNNSIDEIVAKSSQCTSETYIIGGAQAWTFSADGLVQDVVSSSEYGATGLMDIARNSEYVLVRFVVDVTEKDTAGSQENYVNYIGQGIIENVSITGGFDDTATYSVTVRGYGKLYRYINAA